MEHQQHTARIGFDNFYEYTISDQAGYTLRPGTTYPNLESAKRVLLEEYSHLSGCRILRRVKTEWTVVYEKTIAEIG